MFNSIKKVLVLAPHTDDGEFVCAGHYNPLDRMANYLKIFLESVECCLTIMRMMKLSEKLSIYAETQKLLTDLLNKGEAIFIKTKENVVQQSNKVLSIEWRMFIITFCVF
jgi:hypothetical protein